MAPIVVEMFERYATEKHPDMQITERINTLGLQINRDHPFGEDTVRDILCNAYYTGQIRYRGLLAAPAAWSNRIKYVEARPRMD
jgi:hypothetical protein